MTNKNRIDFVAGNPNGFDNNTPPSRVITMSQKANPNTLVECIPLFGFPKASLYLHRFIYLVLRIFFSYMIFSNLRSCSVTPLGLTP